MAAKRNGNHFLPYNYASKVGRYVCEICIISEFSCLMADAPTKEALLESMVPLIEESESWPQGAKYEEKQWHITTQTFTRARTAKDGAAWHGRVSEHSKEHGGEFEPFWNGLGVNHSLHEKEYEVTYATVRNTHGLPDIFMN